MGPPAARSQDPQLELAALVVAGREGREPGIRRREAGREGVPGLVVRPEVHVGVHRRYRTRHDRRAAVRPYRVNIFTLVYGII